MRKSRKLRKPVKPYADSTLETGLKKADLVNHIKRLQTEWAPVYHAHWIYKADARDAAGVAASLASIKPSIAAAVMP